MKNPIFILRLGNSRLCDIDREAIGDLLLDEHDVIGCQLPIGIISIVTSDLSPSDLVDKYSQAADKLNDHGPVVAWNPRTEDASFNLFKDFKVVKELITEWEGHFNEELFPIKNSIKEDVCNLSLNDILDKIVRTGKDSLTPTEFARLKSFSN